MDSETIHILVVTPLTDLRDRVQKALNSCGYSCHCLLTSDEAMVALDSLSSLPYSLMICSYRLPGIKGDELLKIFSDRFPDAPRILMADASDLYAIINSINRAGIHSCLTTPFTNRELTDRVNQAVLDLKSIEKRNHLKKVIERQNRKLAVLATNLKKKEALHREEIASRKQTLKVLKSRARMTGGTAINLEDIIDLYPHGHQPEIFMRLFHDMGKRLTQAMVEAAHRQGKITYTPSPLQRNREAIGLAREVTIVLTSLFHLIKEESQPQQDGTIERQHDSSDLRLTRSPDHMAAYLNFTGIPSQMPTLNEIRHYLSRHNIHAGIKSDQLIQLWLDKKPWESDTLPFLAASGTTPIPSRDAVVTYFFETDYLRAGKLNPDGSMDFKDRGTPPHVAKGTLLAEKTPLIRGIAGMDISGRTIHVEDPSDRPFHAGPGARLSEEETRIFAHIDGQPCLDPMGTVSVFPELVIDGDVGYATGNIEFEGHIRVTGVVRSGFSVKGGSLQAEQIEGAESIELGGDLFVKNGIVNANHIQTLGSIHAAYVHHSVIDCLGDMAVQKEIIDSRIRLSGLLINEHGRIVSSGISAKMGISAGNIGSKTVSSSTLTVGVDTYTRSLIDDLDQRSTFLAGTISDLESVRSHLEETYNTLHGSISQNATRQDRCKLAITDTEKKIETAEAGGDAVSLKKFIKTVTELKAMADQAEEAINRDFKQQDEIADELESVIDKIEENRSDLYAVRMEKERLVAYSTLEAPIPEVRIMKTAAPGTRIETDNTSIVLNEPFSRCRFIETRRRKPDHQGLPAYDIQVSYF